MCKIEISNKDILQIILEDSVLKTQLNNIDWDIINFSLLDESSGRGIIVSESRSF